MSTIKMTFDHEELTEVTIDTRDTAFAPDYNYLTLPTIRKGSTGRDVKFAQYMLYHFCQDLVNSPITDDGVFGAVTETAVKIFQEKNGRGVDGIVGPSTWQRLCPAVMAGYVPSVYWRADRIVRVVQQYLVNCGLLISTDMDGVFGTRTQNAIKAYQKRYGLTQDGAWGKQCWGLMMQGYI